MTQAAIPLGTVKTTPTQDQSPAQLYLVGQEDFVIPLVFPDYLIQVVDETEVNVFGRKILIPAQNYLNLDMPEYSL